MRRPTRVLIAVRDLMDLRASRVRQGLPLDPGAESLRARRVLALLVDAGLCPDGLWFSLPLSGSGAEEVSVAIQGLVPVIHDCITDLPDDDAFMRRFHTRRLVWEIAALVVEVACLTASMRAVHAGCASYVAPADPLDTIPRAACYFDPAGFLVDAKDRLARAKEDVASAQKRLENLRGGLVREPPPGLVLALVEDPVTRGAAQSVPGTVPDLFAGMAAASAGYVRSPSSSGLRRRKRARLKRGDREVSARDVIDGAFVGGVPAVRDSSGA